MINKPTQPTGVKQEIDLSKTTSVTCEKCNKQYFQQAFIFRKISALLSPNGMEILVPIQVFGCVSCGHVNDQFIPEELKSISNLTQS